MASVQFNPALGIQSVSGRLGKYIFYTRNGKQFVREKPSKRTDIERTSNQHRTDIESEQVIKIVQNCKKH